jgi:hypothetical protein
VTCIYCTALATASYKGRLFMCRPHFDAAIVEEVTAILERAALQNSGRSFEAIHHLDGNPRNNRAENLQKLVMRQNDPAGTWSYEGPTYTLEGQG